jgi:cytochrome P450
MTTSTSTPTERRMFSYHEAFAKGQPYDHYRWFREHDPVHFGEETWPQGKPAVFLFRFADVMSVLRNPNVGVETRKLALEVDPDRFADFQPSPLHTVMNNFMLFRDPPDHTRLRRVANMAFTPKNVARLRPDIERIASSLIAELRESDGPVDLIENFTYPLPVMVIGKILGVPEVDLPKFREWASMLASAIDLQLDEAEEGLAEARSRSAVELYSYLADIIAIRRKEPQDDLISAMIHAESEEGRMTEEELVATAILLLFAGHETTTNLIGNGTLALLQHQDQWKKLIDDRSLAAKTTEELLRFESPVQLTTRGSFADIPVGDKVIPRGTEIHFLLGSANRDELVFPDPDKVDITRDVGRTMAFGIGIHFCLGSALARLEGEIAFETLAREAPDLQLATDNPTWRQGVVLHGLTDLPVAFG